MSTHRNSPEGFQPAPSGSGALAWTRALARGESRKKELIRRAGGCLSSREVTDLLGISERALQEMRGIPTILAVQLGNGDWGFPARQFLDGAVREGVAEVVATARQMNSWVLLSILMDDADAERATLLERLTDEAVRADVLQRVRSYGQHVAT